MSKGPANLRNLPLYLFSLSFGSTLIETEYQSKPDMMMTMNHKKTIRYRNLLIRIIASIFASGIVMLHGKDINLFRALHHPSFYPVLGISSVISFGLILYIHYITLWLDGRFDWLEKPYRRSMLQVALGFLGAVFLTFLLMSIYFRIVGRDIFESGYMKFDFPLVVLMLLIVNLYYLIYYLWLTVAPGTLIPRYGIAGGNGTDIGRGDNTPEAMEKESGFLDQNDKEETPGAADNQKAITVYSGTQDIHLDVNEEVCFFYRSGKSNWLLTFSGEAYIVNRSLNELEETFCGDCLFRINRKIIINYNAIRDFAEGSSRTLALTLKPEYENLAKRDDFRTVNRSKYSTFKSWFKA